MIRIRGYKYRAYPDRRQREFFAQNFGCCRFVYNHYLSLRKRAWAEGQKRMTYSDTCSDLSHILKKENPWLKAADSIALQQSLRHLDRAFQGFFAQKADIPDIKTDVPTRDTIR